MNSSNPPSPIVVVVGAMGLDIPAVAGSTPGDDDSTPGSVQFFAGGVGRNIAEGLSRLSLDCRFHSLIGRDLPGDQVLQLSAKAGLASDRVVRKERGATPVYVSVNDNRGRLLYAISDMALMDNCQPEDFKDLARDLNQAALCVIDANLPVQTIQWLIRHSADTSIVAEAVSVQKCQRLSGLLSSIDVLKVNLKEAAQLAGTADNVKPEQLASMLLDKGVGAVLLTLGEHGVMYASKINGIVNIKTAGAFDTEIKSVNGAGDSLLAGFIAARLYGYSIEIQLKWGSEAARLSLMSDSACSGHLSLNALPRTES